MPELPGGVLIDVRNLGEYNSTLSDIAIHDLTARRVVWRVRARQDFIAIHTISIRPGSNPRDLGLNDYSLDVVIPSYASSVEFTPGHRYRVHIDGDAWLGARLPIISRAEFRL